MTIDKLKEQLEWEAPHILRALLEIQNEWAKEKLEFRERLEEIYDLSFGAWEQVPENPEEAKKLFRKIHSIASGGEYMLENPDFYEERNAGNE